MSQRTAWLLFGLLLVLVCGSLLANISFISHQGRLPNGNGELINWLLGLQ